MILRSVRVTVSVPDIRLTLLQSQTKHESIRLNSTMQQHQLIPAQSTITCPQFVNVQSSHVPGVADSALLYCCNASEHRPRPSSQSIVPEHRPTASSHGIVVPEHQFRALFRRTIPLFSPQHSQGDRRQQDPKHSYLHFAAHTPYAIMAYWLTCSSAWQNNKRKRLNIRVSGHR